MAILPAIIILFSTTQSCSHFSSSQNTENSLSDSAQKIDGPEQKLANKPVIMEQLDSLKKNLMVFAPLGPNNTLSPAEAKKMKQDSLYKELKLKPKHIYLTFDDGPLLGSSVIDSIITAKGIKASVFLIGLHSTMSKKRHRDLENYKANPLIGVYNHSYSHAREGGYMKFYANITTSVADFERAESVMELEKKIVRLPGRNIWLTNNYKKFDRKSGSGTAELLHQKGYNIYGWDIEWHLDPKHDSLSINSETLVYDRINKFLDKNYTFVPNNVVLLMHDNMFKTQEGASMLCQLIDKLKADSMNKFEKIEDYPILY